MNHSIAVKLKHHIVLDSTYDELARLRQFCKDVVQDESDATETEDLSGRLQLAVTEAVTNVIRHGFEAKQGNPIHCQAGRINDGSLQFEILHQGKPFQPDDVPDIDMPAEGGMGLYLIEQCVDKVEYLQLPDETQCIRFKINL